MHREIASSLPAGRPDGFRGAPGNSTPGSRLYRAARPALANRLLPYTESILSMTRRFFFKTLAATAVLGGCAAGGTWAFLQQPQFGALPEGPALQRILASPHYADGAFHTLLPEVSLGGNGSFVLALLRSLVAKRVDPVPPEPVPARRLPLDAWDPAQDLVVWLGHSSFLIQLGGHRLQT